MGPRLGRVEYVKQRQLPLYRGRASMGPRLGRVEYGVVSRGSDLKLDGFNGATLRTRGILCKHVRF